MNESLLRELVPAVIGILVRRGADFASAEDAVQEALIRALETWPADPPRDAKGWLVTAAWRRFLDATRADDGSWQADGSDLGPGNYKVQVHQTDASGNVGAQGEWNGSKTISSIGRSASS